MRQKSAILRRRGASAVAGGPSVFQRRETERMTENEGEVFR